MTRRALIIGMGIGGMSAAISLVEAGWTPIIIERAADRRKGGYFIGLRDEGKDAAAALGVLDGMAKRTPERAQFWDLRKDGGRSRIADLTNETNAPIALLRGDIEEALWQRVEGQVEVRFDTAPVAILDQGNQVSVKLRTGAGVESEELFDLVIGADGVRSTVRKMVFGSDEAFLRPLGTMLCAFPLANHVPGFDKKDGVILAEAGRSLTVFPLADRPSTALFSYRTKDIQAQFVKSPLETLQEVFSGLDYGHVVSTALRDLSKANDYLFDAVQMVKMPKWSKGRVVLIGDAAWCLTLYSGMGASAGMMGGQALGVALAAHGNDLKAALDAFEQKMRPFVSKNQRFIALRSQLFVPSSRWFLSARKVLWKLLLLTRDDASKSRR